jgi:hypothetical protein
MSLPKGRGFGFAKPEIGQALEEHYDDIGEELGKNAVKDCTQCITAIGDVDCQYTYCYLCDARIPVRKGKECEDCPNHNSFTPGNGCYPQCEHIIPCETEAVDMNPYLRMIMITNVTQKLITKLNLTHPEFRNPLNETRFKQLLKQFNAIKKDDDGKKLFFILNIMLRLNYSWAHGYCNGIKSNKNFINFDSVSKKFIIDNNVINIYLDKIFDEEENWKISVSDEVRNFLSNNRNIFISSKQKNKARLSINEKLKVIINILNSNDYRNYRNVSHHELAELSESSSLFETGGNKNSKLLFKKKGGMWDEERDKNLILILNKIINSDEIINLINLIDKIPTTVMPLLKEQPMAITTPANPQMIEANGGGAIKCKKEHINIKKLKKLIKNLEEKIKNLKLKKGGYRDEPKYEDEEDETGKSTSGDKVNKSKKRTRTIEDDKYSINKQFKSLINRINNTTDMDYNVDNIKILKQLYDDDSIPYIEYYDAVKCITDKKIREAFKSYDFNNTCDLFLILNIVFNILLNNNLKDESDKKVNIREIQEKIQEKEEKIQEKEEKEEKIQEKEEKEEKLKREIITKGLTNDFILLEQKLNELNVNINKGLEKRHKK